MTDLRRRRPSPRRRAARTCGTGGCTPEWGRPRPCSSSGKRRNWRAPIMKAQLRYEKKLRWVWMAPRGRPVVPDVNRTAAGSSTPISQSGRAAPRQASIRPSTVSGLPWAASSEVTVHQDHRHAGVTAEAVEAAAVRDQHLGLGQIDAVADLIVLPPAVHGHGHRSGADRPPEGLDPARLIGAQQPHPVAGLHAVAVGEGRRHCRGVVDVLGEGGAAAVVEEVVAGRAVAPVVRRSGQQVSHAPMRAGHHSHLNAVHRLGDDLEESARPGEGGVGLGDGHRRLLGHTPDTTGSGHCTTLGSYESAPIGAGPSYLGGCLPLLFASLTGRSGHGLARMSRTRARIRSASMPSRAEHLLTEAGRCPRRSLKGSLPRLPAWRAAAPSM